MRMNKFLFYTLQGFTQTPLGGDINNMQILGTVEAVSRIDAFNKLILENSWIKTNGYDLKQIKYFNIV